MDSTPDPYSPLPKLLALKRFEVPPPGFFERFSDRVLFNIKAGSALRDDSWWERLVRMLREQPMLAGSYAVLTLGGILFGLSLYHAGRAPAPEIWPAGAQMSRDYLRRWDASPAGAPLAVTLDPAVALGAFESNETSIPLGPSVLFRPAGLVGTAADRRPGQ